MTTSTFDLPDRLAAKAEPGQIAIDDAHFAAIEASLELSIADLTGRLDAALQERGGSGQEAMDRDLEVHRLTARLRTLNRFGVDLCLGRMVPVGGGEPVYVGRLGLTDPSGRRLLIDWRSPAAEPFFGATHAEPMGLASRRRYRWTGGRVTDYWDEAFTPEGLTSTAALDDQSAFIATLGNTRSTRMRDVLGTIQADQDAIIRADSAGTLVVDGGPGTGKTVVALHRAAYLLYADPRLGHHRGRVLVVGPHQPYLAYVADVLPSLGEEGVQTCTIRDLVPDGRDMPEEADPHVAELKSSAAMVSAVETAVRFYEEPPSAGLTVSTDWLDLRVTAGDWREAFESADPATPHNEARDQVWEELVTILLDKHAESGGIDEDGNDVGGESTDVLRRSLLQSEELLTAFNRAWPLIDAADLVGDLWSVPAYLKHCAPWLSADDRRALHRDEPQRWTVSDLPLLDAARLRLGDPEASRRRRRREAELASQRAERADVLDNVMEVDDDWDAAVLMMLKGQDLQGALLDESALTVSDPDLLAGPFAHIVVDEAQELTDAEWQMLQQRCPTRSFTVVGDRAQSRRGFTESWRERLERVGLDRVELATLTVNYRTPEEVMAEAEPVIRAVLPDANVPTSIRRAGVPVERGALTDLDTVLARWLTEHPDGVGCVVTVEPGSFADLPGEGRIRVLTPELVKGLEFDLVAVVDPASFGDGVEGAVDRYVAMTRATQQLVILTGT